MSLSAAALKLMADKGLTAHDLAEIAAANERAPDSAAEKRRAYDRERKAEKRAEAKSGGMSGGNPPDPAPNERDNLTPTLTPNVISDEITSPIENPKSEVSPEHVIEAWNVMADEAGVPKAKMTPERRKKLKTFVKRHPIDDITEAIWAVPRTPFLRGENDRGWKANIDFMLQPSSFTKMIEGTYGG